MASTRSFWVLRKRTRFFAGIDGGISNWSYAFTKDPRDAKCFKTAKAARRYQREEWQKNCPVQKLIPTKVTITTTIKVHHAKAK